MINTSAGFTDLILGTDLVHTARIQSSLSRHGQTFFQKLLTPVEFAYCFSATKEKVMINRAAGRIAVKEAVAKALGTGLNGLGWSEGIRWQDIEVISGKQGPPELNLHGKARAVAEQMGVKAWRISISHDGGSAIAVAVGLIH